MTQLVANGPTLNVLSRPRISLLLKIFKTLFLNCCLSRNVLTIHFLGYFKITEKRNLIFAGHSFLRFLLWSMFLKNAVELL